MNEGAAALRAILEAADTIARNWGELREQNAMAPWDDFAFYKGNARFANGVQVDLGLLAAKRFKTVAEACDAAKKLVEDRGYDDDYDPPDAVRKELLEAIAAIRARLSS